MQEQRVTLELAGAPHACHAGLRVSLGAPDALLLAWLALEGPTSRERLARLLWPASPGDAARNALRQRLFRLRRQVGDELVSGNALIALAPRVGHDLDLHPGLLGDLQAVEAPELEAWLEGRRAARRAQSRQTDERRIETLEAAGDLASALPLAQALLERDPLSEDAHRRVMRLHYLRGDRAAAMLAFDRCEQLLKHEVGTAPARDTLELLATIERSGTVSPAAKVRGAVPAAVLRPPQLIGRDAELSALRRGLAAGHVVVLTGEAGMGKSRLMQALAQGDAGVLHATGRPGDSLVPYATLARALRQLLDREPAAADAALRRALAPLLPELAGDTAAAPAAPAASPVLALLRRARRSVHTLVLDDLHFADDATLDMLQSLLAAPREGASLRPQDAVGCCLGLRPATSGTRLQGLLDALAAAGPHTRLALQPLTEPQLAELVESLSLPGVRGQALAPALHQRTGGNPLFALETLKLAWHDGQVALAEHLPRPDTLAQLIGQQLMRLSAPALQLARVAAVAGVDFSIPLAESLLGRHALDLADAWAELEAQQVMRGEAFAHDLIHDAVLQGLPEVIARHLHGLAAAWLEAQAGEPARIAAHWEAAGQRARALPALRAAAERAHRALREGERIALLLRAAEIAEAAGQSDEAFALVRSALEGHMNTLRQSDGLPLLERLQALARTPWQQARVAGDRAWYTTVLGEHERAVALGEAALALSRPLGDEALVSSVRQRLGTVLGMVGRFDEALPHMHAAEPWIAAHAAPEDQTEFYGNLAVVLDNLGRPAEAQPYHLRALAASASHGDQAQRATGLANHASSRLDMGDVAGAAEQLAHAQHIVTTFELAGSSAGYIATLQAQCERAFGRYAAALEWCDRAEAILAERNAARVFVAHLHRAHVWLDLGQHARALQVLGGSDGAAARAAAMPARYAVRWLVLVARVLRRLRQDDTALLATAQALAPATGWPELALIVRTEQALALPVGAALAALDAVADEARARQLHGAELGARLHATARVPQLPDAGLRAATAEPWARAAMALAASAEALHADRAWRWLAPARALAQAGLHDEAALQARAGQEWLRTSAALHVAPAFADSFLHQHPTNAALLAWQPERVTPA